MIVLDEQLLGRGLKREIAQWYPGNVRFVIDLRPRSVIKDDAIPGLLRQQNQPTFVIHYYTIESEGVEQLEVM